jgi:aminopeptidase N
VDYSQDFDGGMEYPQLVMINTPYLTDEEELSLTVMHEVAHQWFYSAIGNDQYMEPWLDESFSTFASYVAFYDTADFDWLEEDYSAFSLTAPVSDFSDDRVEQYGDIIYDGGAKMLSDLYNLLGEDVFYDGMQTYYSKYQFAIVTTADFIRVMEDVSGKSLKPFFKAHGVLLEETK